MILTKPQYTFFHSKYFANILTLTNSSRGVERLSQAIFNAKVDLNPHQVEAALFAFKSPTSEGVILADEVGLGKTIEAGLILTQYWCEHKRRIIIIAPASLRKQWSVELYEKFFLDSVILDAQSYRQFKKSGVSEPFCQEDKIIITSYNFAAKMNEEILRGRFDLAVVDEAHKLRNVYKPSSKISHAVKSALTGVKKILLTATPLQNSLLELYGLVSILDEKVFGDKRSFSDQFVSAKMTNAQFKDLKSRISPFCHRTLRKDVVEYVPYTKRIALVQEFHPSSDEQALYNLISEFLQSTNLHAIPKSQKTLIVLIVRKLLASSTRAIENTLGTMIERLENSIGNKEIAEIKLDDDEELISDFIEESEEESAQAIKTFLSDAEIEEIKSEIKELESFKLLASSIEIDAKLQKLVSALEMGFIKQSELGANKKAIIFTESKRTQNYLKEYLELNGFKNKIVLFNGENSDKTSKEIYARWIEKHSGSGKITGSKTADMKQAIVDYFKDEAEILIATEAGSEGINLQFCNLLINYDLPWNPQRIEQRIGRVHRYGQKHDVVVVNFINIANAADQRVYELLRDKFQLFEGVFGSSDEVLGIIENGVDFEKAILGVYQSCRSPKEIQKAFDDLQGELDEKIQKTLKSTRKKLLENFDEDVHKRLKGSLDESIKCMSLYEELFWKTTKIELEDFAEFDDETASFGLAKSPKPTINTGKYQLITKENKENNRYTYRINSPLGEYIINEALKRELQPAKLSLSLSNHHAKISALEGYQGKSGYLRAARLTLSGFEKEEYVIVSALTKGGARIKTEIAEKLLTLKAINISNTKLDENAISKLNESESSQKEKIFASCEKRNAQFFDAEITKLDKWADDQLLSLEKELKELKKSINAKRAESKKANPTDKLKIQIEIREIELKQKKLKKEVESAEEEIYAKRSEIIDSLSELIKRQSVEQEIMTIEWEIV